MVMLTLNVSRDLAQRERAVGACKKYKNARILHDPAQVQVVFTNDGNFAQNSSVGVSSKEKVSFFQSCV